MTACTPSAATPAPHPSVVAQIDDLGLERFCPLVICDADEVLLHFVQSLEQYLIGLGLRLDLVDYRLTGNIKRADNVALTQQEVNALLEAYYARHTATMPAVEGAAEALAVLDGHAQIVGLTNVAHDRGADRLSH